MRVYDKIIKRLRASSVPFIIHEHEAIHTVQEALEKTPDWVERLIKTIAFQIKDGPYVLAAVRGQSRIDYRKLAAVMGVNRRDLRSLSPSEVLSHLGVQVGGVSPFPLWKESCVIFDQQDADARHDLLRCRLHHPHSGNRHSGLSPERLG